MTHLDDFQLNEYLDDMLDESQRLETEAHLAACGECRAALAELQQLFTALAAVKEMPLTADLSARVLADIESEAESATWLRPLLVVQLLAVAGMLVMLWPTIQGWLARAGTAVSTSLAALQPLQISFVDRLASWQTAVSSQLQAPGLAIDLAAAQWGVLIALAFAAWLAGNRLLFTNEQ